MTSSTAADGQERRDAGGRRVFTGTEQPVWAAHDGALMDLDGVVYRTSEAIPHAADAIGRASDAGMRVVYVINNASRTPTAIAAQLKDIGLAAVPEDVVTAGYRPARCRQVEPGAHILVVGGQGAHGAPAVENDLQLGDDLPTMTVRMADTALPPARLHASCQRPSAG